MSSIVYEGACRWKRGGATWICITSEEERTMETPSEMRVKIVGKATEDADFRARLLGDPKAAIGQELGVAIPASMSVEVHEESGTTAHLVLPPDSKLSQHDLSRVSGGYTWEDFKSGEGLLDW